MSKSKPKKTERLRLTWVKSSIGYSKRQKATIKALGFRKLGDVVEHDGTPAVKGMVAKVGHLIRLESGG